jgi:uncharacterized protein YfaS (alpha-2-macroglobulin family)
MKKMLLPWVFVTLIPVVAMANDFNGAVPSPIGTTIEAPGQLQIRFPSQMHKTQQALQVSCSPATEGFESWSDNDTLWTYNFKSSDYREPRLSGGTKCHIEQSAELKAISGQTWSAGALSYDVVVRGPNVVDIQPAGFNGDLREKDPVILITFDGPVDAEKFFAEHDGYLSYTSGNAPAEKIELIQVPTTNVNEIFAYLQSAGFLYDNKIDDKTYVTATIHRDLIPGAELLASVQNVPSAINADVTSPLTYSKKLTVRSNFKAEVDCGENNDARNAGQPQCLPQAPIAVSLNGNAKWSDVSRSYIEYVPYGSKNGRTVRAYPTMKSDQQDGMLDEVSNSFPYLRQFNTTVVNKLNFDVKVAAQTQVHIVLVPDLKDIDGRSLSNSSNDLAVRVGSMAEMIVMPQAYSVFEKDLPGHISMPVAIVNLNQELEIRKSGTESNTWAPIRDIPSIISLMQRYDARGDTRESHIYSSPMQASNQPSVAYNTRLTGEKNRSIYLEFPFGPGADGKIGGVYAIEVSSPTFEAANSNVANNQYANPGFTIAQLTDLSTLIKQGQSQTTVWVTSLSEGKGVANATVEVYNCNAQKILTVVADQNGVANFANRGKWADKCGGKDESYGLSGTGNVFIVVRSGDDFAITNTTWGSTPIMPYSAPGVEYNPNRVTENTPYYHTVIDVNLVKPGQTVPVQILAKWPTARGFQDVAPLKLARKARVVFSNDEKIYKDFPVRWTGSEASFVWPVSDTAKLGSYNIELINSDDQPLSASSGGDIEVAEFKVALMSGNVLLPTQALVRPASVLVNGQLRYANLAGAANVPVELSYFVTPSTASFDKFPGFVFGNGPVDVSPTDARRSRARTNLPDDSRPELIEGLHTDNNGMISHDLAGEKLADGQTLADAVRASATPVHLVTRLRYQDQSGEFQTLSASKDLFNSDYYVGTKLAADAHTLNVAVVDASGNNAAGGADLDMHVYKIESRLIGEQLFGGLIKTTIERETLPVDWTGNCANAQGALSCNIGHLGAGTYAFQATARAYSGQSANVVFKVDADGMVYADGDYSYFGDSDMKKAQLPLTLNKKTYQQGESAVVSFSSPFRVCDALVTIERSDVVKSFVVANACQTGKVQVPIDGSYAPNAFVSVYAIVGRQASGVAPANLGDVDLGRPTYKLGYANLKVDWTKFSAKVTVVTDKPKYEPGIDKAVNVRVNVSADQGAIQNGRVTLVAIEKKILEIKPNESYKVLDALMQSREDSVSTLSALLNLESSKVHSADNRMAAAAPGGRKGGSEGGDGSSGTELKKKLVDALVAYQDNLPVVNGTATFSFAPNDKLTNFVVFAIFNSDNQKFGTGSADYLTEKPTQSVANIPDVGYTGDSFPVNIALQNNSGVKQNYRTDVVVTFKGANNTTIGEPQALSKTQAVDNGRGQVVSVGQVTIPDGVSLVQYQTKVYDAAGTLVDEIPAANSQETILPAVPMAIHASYIQQVVNGVLNQPLEKAADALANKGEIRVSVESSLVGAGLAQLSDKMNRDPFAELFEESRILKALAQGSAAHPEALKKALDGIAPFLDDQGFVKYYTKAQRGDVWLTAAVINVLATEKWAIKAVPASVVDQWKAAITKVLNKSADPLYFGTYANSNEAWMRAQTQMAVAALAFGDDDMADLASQTEAKITSTLATNPSAYGATLDQWNNSALVDYWMLQSLLKPETALSSPIYAQLTAPARMKYSGNYSTLSGHPETAFENYYSDQTVQTAQLLSGLARIGGESTKQTARALALGLINSSADAWYVVRSMAWTAQSLKLFAQAYERFESGSTGQTTVGLASGGQPSMLTLTPMVTRADVVMPFAGSSDTVQVRQVGAGQPWIAIQALTAVPLTRAYGEGISVDKQIKNLSRTEGYKAGDMIEVTLKINSVNALRQAGLVDPIPSGSNILADAYGDFDSGEKSYKGYKFYFSYLPEGLTQVKYQYQLNNVGTFNIPPTRAEGLYMPSVFGEAPNAAMTVEAQQ